MQYIDQATVDFIVNGEPTGELANRMDRQAVPGVRFDPGLMRPWVDGDGQTYLDICTGKIVTNKEGKQVAEHKSVPLRTFVSNGLAPPVFNSSALPRLVWERIDRAVIQASRDRLTAYADVAAVNTFGGFDGMAVMAISRDTMTDAGQAVLDMDGLSEGMNDGPIFTSDMVALPICHVDFFLSQRTLAVSRNSGVPLDTTTMEQASTRVSETIEKMTIGVTDLSSSFVLGSSTDFTNRGIYGFVTHPDRITKTDLTAVAGDTVAGVKDDVIAMITLAYAQKFYGPFNLYYNSSYDTLMNDDYWVYTTSGGAAPSKTLKQRLEMIEGISAVKRLDLMGSTQRLVLVQMRSPTVRVINGMLPTTIMWESRGGRQVNLSVAAIQIPDIRSQYVGTSTSSRKAGVVSATTS